MAVVVGLVGLAGCKNKCEKLERHMLDIGLGFADAEREKKTCNSGEYSDEYLACAMKAESRSDLADCGW